MPFSRPIVDVRDARCHSCHSGENIAPAFEGVSGGIETSSASTYLWRQRSFSGNVRWGKHVTPRARGLTTHIPCTWTADAEVGTHLCCASSAALPPTCPVLRVLCSAYDTQRCQRSRPAAHDAWIWRCQSVTPARGVVTTYRVSYLAPGRRVCNRGRGRTVERLRDVMGAS